MGEGVGQVPCKQQLQQRRRAKYDAGIGVSQLEVPSTELGL